MWCRSRSTGTVAGLGDISRRRSAPVGRGVKRSRSDGRDDQNGSSHAGTRTIHAEAPGARFVRLEAPPVVGGVLLGMEQVGINIADVRPKLLETIAQDLEET